MIDAPPALALEHIEKHFAAVRALSDASLVVRPGSVHALLGENGAGKTTLMRIAYGMETPDRGSLLVHGRAIRLRSPADAIAHGIGMVHQHFTLVPAMTAAENLALGSHGSFDSGAAAEQVRRLTRSTGLAVDPDARVRDLSVSAQQRLELLKVLSRDSDTLILDEPTAVLAPAEAHDLLRQLRQLADAGRAVVLITHKLREALDVADDVTVLRHGSTKLGKPRGEVSANELVEAMLGNRLPHAPSAPRETAPGKAVISARDVSIADARGTTRIRNATFEVRSGEILGVAAVEGSGHRELLRALAGRLPIVGGALTLPRDVGFVPDDRHRDGLVLAMSLSENYALRGAGKGRGIIHWTRVAQAAREIMNEFSVVAETERVIAGTLSGGNQQKFVLGRELRDTPPALVVENPTRGLDINASAFVLGRMALACAAGVAIVMHSQDLDELIEAAHRMVVVYAGTVREVPIDTELIGRAMLGAA